MSIFFLDTSALVKQYRQEQGTAQVQSLFDNAEHELIISELALVEFASAFQRLLNRGEIDEAKMTHAVGKFDADAASRFTIVELRGGLVQHARTLLQQHKLRALDALQLAAVLSAKQRAPVFVSADERLIQAAQAHGLSTFNPVSSV
jgi:predicted nucleic acid-binding protein